VKSAKPLAVIKRENIITYLRHQITNAASESLNAKIQWGEIQSPRDFGINRTSSMRSTFIVEVWISILRPLNSPKRLLLWVTLNGCPTTGDLFCPSSSHVYGKSWWEEQWMQ
jgi:hypothetical protein